MMRLCLRLQRKIHLAFSISETGAGAVADLRCMAYELTHCGQTGLLLVQLLLMQQLLALAAQGSLRCGEMPQTGRSITSERIESKLPASERTMSPTKPKYTLGFTAADRGHSRLHVVNLYDRVPPTS
jgi:hypothetical protein